MTKTIKILGAMFGVFAFILAFFASVGVASAKTTTPGIKSYLRAAPIVVTFEGNRWVASGTEILKWISRSESGVVSVDPSSFVNTIANQVNVQATDNAEGRSVNTDNLTGQIKDILDQGQRNQIIALVTTVVPRGGDKRIEINLSDQSLTAWEGNRLANHFLISSGKRGYETPTGDYSVWGKTRSQTMSGPGYRLPNVQWISWFNGEIAIHGTYWHNHFGMPMSHGCINASEENAQWVYEWDNIDTPVNVHY